MIAASLFLIQVFDLSNCTCNFVFLLKCYDHRRLEIGFGVSLEVDWRFDLRWIRVLIIVSFEI